jgi:osmotically-inducible protein OsmY
MALNTSSKDIRLNSGKRRATGEVFPAQLTRKKETIMKIAYKLAIVCSAMILAAGCRSNQERASRNENYSAGSSSYESGATTSSSTTSGQPGDQSLTPGSSQSSAGNASQSGLTESDRMLSRQVQQQLQNDPSLAAAAPSIQVSAQNGTVILSGNVKSDQDKEKIESTVRGITGVVSVNNQLQVSLQPTSEPAGKSSRIYSERSSESAAVKSDSASQSSVSSPSPSQSDAKDQASAAPVATEPPTQGSAAADQTQGAKDKPALSPTSDKGNDTSRVYSKDQTDSANSSSTSQTLDASKANIQASTDADRTLGQQIMSNVQADASLATLAPMIKLKVDSGKVILHGTVKSEQDKQNIEAAVQKVSGVTSVDNRLKVSSSGQSDSTDSSSDSSKTPDTK